MHPISLANLGADNCNEILFINLNDGDFQIPLALAHKTSRSKIAIHELLDSQSSTHGHPHAKSIRTNVL